MIKLFDNWLEATFIARPNRFVMILKYHNKTISAYVPNTGRMEEFCIPGQIFYLTEMVLPKFDFKVIGTRDQGHFVFLDTIKINRIFQYLLESRILGDQMMWKDFRREVKLANSRFDFLLHDNNGNQKIVEIKSCTLCHNGVAMFPDAPTIRGKRHLSDLEELGADNYQSHIVYLVAHEGAEFFVPNFHTDPDYARTFLAMNNVSILALKLKFNDPITIIPESTKLIPIRTDLLKRNMCDKGNYLIVIENKKNQRITTGALGNIEYKCGYYVYTGSAMNSLSKRINRHKRKRKKLHWHIDYILSAMTIAKIYPIQNLESREEAIAEQLLIIADNYIPQFGSSDSKLSSHLTFFQDNPIQNRDFINLLLDFRMNLDFL